MPLVTEFSTIAEMLPAVVEYFRDSKKDAFRRKVNGSYVGISHSELYEQVEALALALRELGLTHGDRVGLMSENRLEWVVADMACACSGLVDVPIFPILTPKQVAYIFNDAQVKVVFCSNRMQLGKLMKVIDEIPSLKHVIVMQADALEGETRAGEFGMRLFDDLLAHGRELARNDSGTLKELIAATRPEDLLTLIYTSGTTGNPKGVMLTHGNITANMTGASQALPIAPDDVVLSYLPLCHSYERTAGYYTCFACGATIAFADSIETVSENLLEVRPTLMTSVPRLFERIKNRVEKNARSGSDKKRKIFEWAVEVGVKRYRREERGKMVGPVLRSKTAVADRLVFSKIRERTGGRLRFFVSGGAALPRDVAEFFFAVGMQVLEGYGLTETSPVLAVNPYGKSKIGTVGPPLPNVELKIAHDGEILTRGPHVMKGYLNDPDATMETIDVDGWLHTGDIGELDSDGYLKITDRKKHIFVSSGGKNIAPGPIEEHLLQSRLIDQIMLVGDKRPFITALVVPDFQALAEVVQMQGLPVQGYRTREERRALVEQDAAILAIESDIKQLQRELSTFERVRRFELMDEEFTVENGMLTPTLKVKRKVVEGRYADKIEGMYEGVQLD